MTSLATAIVHGLGLLGLAVLLGGLVFERFVLPAGLPETAIVRARLRPWLTLCASVLFVVTLADLLTRVLVMTRAPLASAVAALPEVLTRTHIGVVLAVRLVLLALIVVTLVSRATVARASGFIFALGIALTNTLTGHAAYWGDLSVSVAADWLHAVSASAWTGGLFVLVLLQLGAARSWSPVTERVVAQRVSLLSGFCLLAVVVTGGYNAWSQLGAVSRVWTTTYGRLLLAKVAVGALLAVLGAVNRYIVVPQLGGGRVRGFGARLFRLSRLALFGPRPPATSPAPTRFKRFVAGEAAVALAVFASTAALGQMTPGRHTAFDRKPMSHVTPIEPRAAGAAPRAGVVTPPPGDAVRGRAVFVKLECFTCHAILGEGLPPASRSGPD